MLSASSSALHARPALNSHVITASSHCCARRSVSMSANLSSGGMRRSGRGAGSGSRSAGMRGNARSCALRQASPHQMRRRPICFWVSGFPHHRQVSMRPCLRTRHPFTDTRGRFQNSTFASKRRVGGHEVGSVSDHDCMPLPSERSSAYDAGTCITDASSGDNAGRAPAGCRRCWHRADWRTCAPR